MGIFQFLGRDPKWYSAFKDMDKEKSNPIRLSNGNLDFDYSHNTIDPRLRYTNLIFIDDVLDSEVNYTLLYNAKVGTIVPIRLEDLSNMDNCWIKCDGSTYTKDQYPMLFDLIYRAFYDLDINDNEIPLYTDEFVVPKLDNKKIEDTEVVFMIKAKGREKGNCYLKRDNQT